VAYTIYAPLRCSDAPTTLARSLRCPRTGLQRFIFNWEAPAGNAQILFSENPIGAPTRCLQPSLFRSEAEHISPTFVSLYKTERMGVGQQIREIVPSRHTSLITQNLHPRLSDAGPPILKA